MPFTSQVWNEVFEDLKSRPKIVCNKGPSIILASYFQGSQPGGVSGMPVLQTKWMGKAGVRNVAGFGRRLLFSGS